MTNKLFPFLLFTFFFLGVDCKDDPPVKPPVVPPPTVELAVADTGVTEMWLTLKFTDTTPPRGFAVTRNNAQILSGLLSGSDTLFVDTTAQPKQTYIYKAYRLDGATLKDSGTAVQATTLDTTNHNYTFTIDTLGEGASSILYDVAIINDTLVYAVGEIYLKDSSGNFEAEPYGMAIWNGKEWKLKKLYYTSGSGNTVVLSNIRGILYRSSTEIWFAAGSIFRWDGISNMTQLVLPRSSFSDANASVEKFWGTAEEIYGVGNAGTIVRYTSGSPEGTGWQKIESGTSVNINDVWGDQTGEFVLAAASNRYNTGERKLLRINNNNTVEILDWSPQQRLHSLWFKNANKIFAVGGKVYVGVPGKWQEILWPEYFATRVRGTALNNIWIVGAFGLCGHFNGSTWKSYTEAGLANGTYEGLAVIGNKMIAVGQVGNRAVILRGKLN